MSDAPGQGRARGRGGRGRARGQLAPPGQAPPPAEPVRQPQPGVAPPTQAAPVGRGRARGAAARQEPVGVQQEAPAAPAEGVTGGRGMQRGGGRERPSGNGNGGPPTAEMGAMSLTSRRRMPYEKYIPHPWKKPEANSVGTSGDRVSLATNYFPVQLPSEVNIFQYHVDFKPEVENVKVKFGLISSLSSVVGNVKCFDGGILYLCRMLPSNPYSTFVNRSYDGMQIEVTFKFTCEVHAHSPQFLQIANLLFKKVQISLDMKLIRDHYFNPGLSVKVQKHNLEVVPGFTTSILKYDAGNMLGIDIIHKILRVDTLLDCLYTCYNDCHQDQSMFHNTAIRLFVGSIVMTRHNNKTYRVDDIDWDARPSNTFEKNGQPITYFAYYKEHWNIDIHDAHQPLIISRPTEKDLRRGERQNVYLVPELCTVTGLDDKQRADFEVMKDLGIHTRIGPDQRIKTLEKFLTQVNESQKVAELLDPWQMSIGRKICKINGRQLPAESLLMKNQNGDIQKISYNIKTADWSRNMRDVALLNPVHMTNWIIIYPAKSSGLARELSDCLSRVGRGMNMKIGSPYACEIHNDRNDSYLQAIRQNLNEQVQMVVTVVPNVKKDRYDAIKKSCCIDNPVPSQVVTTKVLAKKQGLMSVATKIAIQLNCKMGGEVWGGEIPVKGMMVIGIDAYHDSANKNESVGAMVASLNKECTRYYSKTEYHPSKEDMFRSLHFLFSGALKKYHEVNGQLPQKIILYRDGVGDGQLKTVFDSELEQILSACKQAGGEGYKPGLAFIVVKKRISTRLFQPEGGQMVNPQPGTVVDQFVTRSEWYDFFLVSQSVRQGTVTPTSFNVIYDNSGLLPDHLQRLTYKLTHLYFNWQGTIRVPAPCQYAHKLAFLQGQSLHREFSAHLCDKLFYL